jgi:hypothetical protein
MDAEKRMSTPPAVLRLHSRAFVKFVSDPGRKRFPVHYGPRRIRGIRAIRVNVLNSSAENADGRGRKHLPPYALLQLDSCAFVKFVSASSRQRFPAYYGPRRIRGIRAIRVSVPNSSAEDADGRGKSKTWRRKSSSGLIRAHS